MVPPVTTDSSESTPADPHPPRRAAGHVLVVEDDSAIREALRDALTQEGFVVELARDGREALTKLGAAPLPRVVLLDLMMPQVDGWAVLEARARAPALAALPVIVVSAFPPQGVLAPNTAWMRKPLDLGELVAALDGHVLA